MSPIKAWHFTTADRRLRYGDDRIVEPGQTITVDCTPVLCESGLHASRNVMDALHYAPGPYVWRVEVSGDVVEGGDKLAGTSRTALWGLDASELLRRFARRCALDVVHLWECPDVVRRWLATGDEAIRRSAYSAARSAAYYAACSGAEPAARYAAYSAADSAADSAAYYAACSGAEPAAHYAAYSAAHYAAYSAADSAAYSAADSAAKTTQSRRLAAMIHAEHRRITRG